MSRRDKFRTFRNLSLTMFSFEFYNCSMECRFILSLRKSQEGSCEPEGARSSSKVLSHPFHSVRPPSLLLIFNLHLLVISDQH